MKVLLEYCICNVVLTYVHTYYHKITLGVREKQGGKAFCHPRSFILSSASNGEICFGRERNSP